MGLFSAVLSVASAAVSVIGGLAGSVASTLISVVTSPATWNAISGVVNIIGSVLNIFPANCNPEQHGEKVLAAAEAGIKADDFSSFEEYASAIKNFEVKPELKEKWSTGDKIAASAGVVAQGLTEIKGFSVESAVSLIFLVAQKSDFFTPERVGGLLEKTQDFQQIRDYLEGDLDRFDSKEVETLLLKNEQGLAAGINPEAFSEKLRSMREEHQQQGN